MLIEEDEAGHRILAPIELSIAPLRLSQLLHLLDFVTTSTSRIRPDVVYSTLRAIINSLVGLYPPTCRSYPAILLELCAFVRPHACAGMDAHSFCDRDSGMSTSHTLLKPRLVLTSYRVVAGTPVRCALAPNETPLL